MNQAAPDVSVVIVTRNRRAKLLATLDALAQLPDHHHLFLDTWVVDNASDDGSADAAADHPLRPRVIRLEQNEGVSARNHAFARAVGRNIALLDDDSTPDPGALARAARRLDAEPDLAAVTGPVRLTAGGLDSCGLPTVPILCGVVLKASALRIARGLHTGFVRQAEEYPLALRLFDAGLRIDRDDRVGFRHHKTPGPFDPERLRLDRIHNLAWLTAMCPPHIAQPYAQDTRLRYRLLAKHAGADPDAPEAPDPHDEANAVARAAQGLQPVAEHAVEALFETQRIAKLVANWAAHNHVQRPALLGYGKNLYAAWSACHAIGATPAAIYDDRPAFTGSTYRGAPVLPIQELTRAQADGVVVSETAPARVEAVVAQGLALAGDRPLLGLSRGDPLHPPSAERDSSRRATPPLPAEPDDLSRAA
ncbi:MAG: glycosyltransferase family 2 protein [Planctomycetota bacterium]